MRDKVVLCKEEFIHPSAHMCKGVNMRPEIKFQSTIKEVLFILLFIAEEISFRGWPLKNGSFNKS